MKTKLIAALAFSVLLVGCGGGGGGTSSSPGSSNSTTTVASTTTTTVATYPGVVTSVPAPTYASADNINAFNLLNSLRSATGVGEWAEDAHLDQAAQAHTSYIINNNLLSNVTYLTSPSEGLHWEDSTLPGYTGSTPQLRAMAAGFGGSVGETANAGDPTGASCVHGLVEDTVYHRALLMSSATHVGLSFASNSSAQTICVVDFGIPTGEEGQLPTNIVSYPYNGKTGVDTTFYVATETPNPAPDLTTAGIPVMVSLYSQTTLPTITSSFTASQVTITQFSMTVASSGAAVSSRILAATGVVGSGVTVTSDTELASIGAGYVFLLPIAPLQANTTYNVAFAATVNGISVSKNWSFQTGASN